MQNIYTMHIPQYNTLLLIISMKTIVAINFIINNLQCNSSITIHDETWNRNTVPWFVWEFIQRLRIIDAEFQLILTPIYHAIKALFPSAKMRYHWNSFSSSLSVVKHFPSQCGYTSTMFNLTKSRGDDLIMICNKVSTSWILDIEQSHW